MNWTPNRRVMVTLLVATMLLLAGCGGPADDANGTNGGAGLTPGEDTDGGTDDGADDGADDGLGTETTEDEPASIDHLPA